MSGSVILGREYSLALIVTRAVRVLSGLSIIDPDQGVSCSTSGLTLDHNFFAAHDYHVLIIYRSLS